VTASEQALPPRYEAAMRYGMRGLRLLPVEYHSREAILPRWQQNAANDVAFIDAHWASGRNNIGLCCGPQPNGWNILVVDIDDQAAWQALEAEYGPIDRTSVCFHRTPTGGTHLFFNVPEGLAITRTDVPVKGIDLRGGQLGNVGCGYVVLTESEAPDKKTGELKPYWAKEGRGLLDRDPGPPSEWLLDFIKADLAPKPPKPSTQASQARHPSNVRDETPGQWVRDHLRWEDYLLKWGWTPDGAYWVRPKKSARDGHSAQLHDNGRFAFWSQTDLPPALMELGSRQVDGGYSISLYDFIAAYEFGGDRSALGRYVRMELMPPTPGAGSDRTPEAVLDDTPTLGLNLPPEFWTSRPWLTHLRDAAWAVGSTPDAQLIVCLTRYATMIPPGLHIPAIVRAKGSFDLMTVVVAASGQGKSSLMMRAEELLPSARTDLRFGLGLSSGEGIVEMYYGTKDVIDGNGKAQKERALVYPGINFVIDEGALLASLAGRSGFTGVERLLTAWSGGTLSTANATQDRFRHVPAGQYRFTCAMAIQTELSAELWAGTRTAQGFTGRLLMMMSRGGDVPPPGQRPTDPGPLDLPTPPSVNLALSYPQAVWDEVQWNDYAKQDPAYVEDALVAHRDLQRLKLAGILACADGRTDVDLTDWELASQIVTVSSNVRTWLQHQTAAKRREMDAQVAESKGRTQAAVANAEHQAHVGRVARRLLSFLSKEPMLISQLRKQCNSRDRQPYFKDAVDSLVETGMAKSDGKSIWT
jgi:Bifunctional DNA primase/polymerase, N-terminal